MISPGGIQMTQELGNPDFVTRMSHRFVSIRRFLPRALVSVAVLGLAFWVGCSDDEENPMNPGGGATSTTFSGMFIGGGDGGRMSLTIATTSLAPALRSGSLRSVVVTASGSLDLDGGAVIPFTGTYDTVTDSMDAFATDPLGDYTLAGAYDSTGTVGGVLGSYDGPNGSGFFGCLAGTPGSITTLCGSFDNQSMTETGLWNTIIYADEVAGAAVPDGSSTLIGFEGTVTGTGNPRQISIAGSDGAVDLTATGTWDTVTNQITGTWDTVDSGTQAPIDNGTWSGDPCD